MEEPIDDIEKINTDALVMGFGGATPIQSPVPIQINKFNEDHPEGTLPSAKDNDALPPIPRGKPVGFFNIEA